MDVVGCGAGSFDGKNLLIDVKFTDFADDKSPTDRSTVTDGG